jgi:hypothetical protein
MEEFLEFTLSGTGLQKLDEFDSECAVEPLASLQGQAEELHPELVTLDPFNLAKLNGQRLWVIGEQHTHTDITAAEDLSIAHDRTPHQ